MKDDIQITIPSKLGYEKVVMEAVATLAKLQGFREPKLSNLRTAVSEACINAIEHGNTFSKQLAVEIRVRHTSIFFEIDVIDSGKGMVIKPETPHLSRKLSGIEASRGWGVFLIEKLIDSVDYLKDDQNRNVTRLRLKISRRKTAGVK